MAITTLSPDTCGTPAIEDPVSLKEAVLMFREANIRISDDTILRWARQDGLRIERRGRKVVVDYSDLLEAYTRRYPVPGRS
ncbi:hypothetical protein [Streptomyces sp. NPDC048521]|uniref:hypothetical protein n=1 Tax=Streptomyces sp. NPDC048521 TaxID=3365566 RepID=UPI00372102C3